MSENQEKKSAQTRPPIVVILGHVDHGKTKLLDFIRKTKREQKESGGFTQHIGDYQANYRGRTITFLDTPGHEAFSAIRSRGAKVADIAILVIAADEGVKPQTKEAIKIIEESKTPFIVALNKIDKPEANVQRVKQELAENSVFVEGYGGSVSCVEVSAKEGTGVDALLDMILLTADVENIINDTTNTNGLVIESHLDNRRGMVATLLPQNGTLNVGDWLVVGSEAAKIKAMEDFRGKSITSAVASQPVVILGWTNAPVLGEPFVKMIDKDQALTLAEKNLASKIAVGLFSRSSSRPKNLALIIKADVASSLEAIDQVLQTINSPEVGYQVVDYGVGPITEADIQKAVGTKALIVGFRVTISNGLKLQAERAGVIVQNYDIIYELVSGVKERVSELLDAEIVRTPLGKLKVLALFKREGKNQVVGGKVVSGKVVCGAMIDLSRNNLLVATGRLAQLQQQKQDVSEVAEGLECGIRFDFVSPNVTPNMYIRVGDVLEVYSEEKVKRSL